METEHERKLMIVEKEHPDKDIGHIDLDITAEFSDEMTDLKVLVREGKKEEALTKIQEIIDQMERHINNE